MGRGSVRIIMVKNNQLVHESGLPIEMGDRIHVITPTGESLILHLTQVPQGMIIINGQEQVQMVTGFFHKASGQVFQPDALKDCKIYEVIDIETGEQNEKVF